jgi:hypothetical protein
MPPPPPYARCASYGRSPSPAPFHSAVADNGHRHCEERKRRSNPDAAPPNWIASLTLAMTSKSVPATPARPSYAYATPKTLLPSTIPSDLAGGGTGFRLDHAQQTKGRRNAGRRIVQTAASADAARAKRRALACRRSTTALAAASERHSSTPVTRFLGPGVIRCYLHLTCPSPASCLADRS